MNHDRYKYKYEKSYFAGSWSHSYSLVGRYGGLSLNIREYKDTPSAGLEYHYRQPKDYMDDCPSHEKCHVINGPCWHDGTSLYARERYLPLFEAGYEDLIFSFMTSDANEAFYPDKEDEPEN